MKEGQGEAIKPGAKVTVHYTGWLTNGKQFDSSAGRPADHLRPPSGHRGLDPGHTGHETGGRPRLKIPSELGYGKSGAGADIPPNSVLVFEVELIK